MDVQASLDNALISCVVDGEETLFDPVAISRKLESIGFIVQEDLLVMDAVPQEPDRELVATEKVIRAFMRGTQHNEDTLRMKLGLLASSFFDDALPALIRTRVLELVPYRGSGNQERFRLAKHMSALQDAIARSGGSFKRFLREVGD